MKKLEVKRNRRQIEKTLIGSENEKRKYVEEGRGGNEWGSARRT